MITLKTKSVFGLVAGLAIALSLVIGAGTASALTAADIDLLVAMGIVSADKAATAKAALVTTQYANLKIGSTGADVVSLQEMLVKGGYLVMPAGVKYGYYGSLTAAAYAKYQAAQVATPVVTTTTTTTSGSTELKGDAGDLVGFKKFTSGVENTVAEDSEEKVLGIELEASKDSDLKVTSMKLSLNRSSGSGSTRPDRYFEEVSIMQGSKVVATVDISDLSKSGTTYSRSVALSNAVIKSGDKSKFYVVAKTKSGIDSAADRLSKWTVEATQVRYTDATGAIMTETGSGVSAAFGFESSTANDEIRLLSASNNPASSNLKVNENTTSDEYLALSFRLKANSDSSDLNVLEIPVAVEITSASGTVEFNSDELISDIWLKVGNTVYDDFDNTVITVATTSATTTTYTFNIDEGDLEINAGDTEEVRVFVKFGSQKNTFAVGTKIKLSVDGSKIIVENVNGDSVDSPSGSAVGNEHTTQLETVNFSLKSVSVQNVSESDSDPYVTITMPLQIVSDDTLYIVRDATASAISVSTTTGATTTVQFASGSNTPSIVTSGGVDYYEISGTKVVYLKFIVNGSKTGTVKNYNVLLNSVTARTEIGGTATVYPLSPSSSFDTDATLRY